VRGLVQQCTANGNVNFGFDDQAPTTGSSTTSQVRYIASASQGNGVNPAGSLISASDTNYSVKSQNTANADLIKGFRPYEAPPVTTTTGYWSNVSMP